MTQQYPGGYVTKAAPVVNINAAPGMWTLDQAAQYQSAGIWPIPVGQEVYATAGTYSWQCPVNVTSICVVCIGGGGSGGGGGGRQGSGGGGGSLSYKNSITVVPGTLYTVTVGAGGATPVFPAYLGTAGGVSSFEAVCVANGGGAGIPTTSSGNFAGGAGGTRGAGDGGGNGGAGGIGQGTDLVSGGGGGAGGYAGNGGGAGGILGPTGRDGAAGSGGAGGGGASSDISVSAPAGNGGGVGILGQGSSGAGGTFSPSFPTGGSGSGGIGITYGAGSGGVLGVGGGGVVRIIWGPGRAFPATNTGNL